IIGKYTASHSSTASITLDAYPTLRTSSFTHLADNSLRAAGGMATFSPCQTSASMMDSSSASAAIVAAAAAAASTAGNKIKVGSGGKSSASTSLPYVPSSAKIAAMLEAQRSQHVSNIGSLEFPACSTALNSSLVGMGMGMGIGMDMNAGLDFSAAMSACQGHAGTPPNSAPAMSLSVPASDYAASTTNQLLMLGDIQRGISRSTTASYLSGSDGSGDQHQLDDSTRPLQSEQMMSQSSTSQFDFAGMVSDYSAPHQHVSPASLLRQAASDDGPEVSLSASLAGNAQKLRQDQGVVRGSSVKRTTQCSPYSVERGERHRDSRNSSNGECAPDRPREHVSASPSVPLILEHQQAQCGQPYEYDTALFGSTDDSGLYNLLADLFRGATEVSDQPQ
ncbi:hypothetical protein GGI21_005979, partial [Coemansia aciculifera]